MAARILEAIRRWTELDATILPVLRLMYREKKLLFGLVSSSLVSAFTEGLGITMLVPLLAAINSGADAFKSIPIFGRVTAAFSGVALVPRLEIIAAALCVLSICRGAMSYLTVVCAELLALRIDTKLRRRGINKVLFLNFEDAQSVGTPMLLNHVMGYSVHVAQMSHMLALILTNAVMLLLYVSVCLLVSVPLTVLAAFMLLAAVQFVKLPLADRVRQSSAVRDTAHVALYHHILGAIRGLKLLRLFRGEAEKERQIGEELTGYVHAEQSGLYLRALVDPMFQVAVAIIVSILLFSSTLVFGDKVVDEIPSIILFMFVLSRMASPVQTINRARISVAFHMHGAGLLFDFLDPKNSMPEPDGVLPIAKLQRRLAFENVTFGYRSSTTPVINDVSFDIPIGGMTALVGPSGAGKTTLIGLLAGMFRPQSGGVVVDDERLVDLKMSDWRSRVAFVMQDTIVLDDTISANLRIGRKDATREQLEEAARRAHAHDFISALPAGYETFIGEKGIQLSGGQAQRLALARALLVDPDLLVLDEATSNLDAETESIIKKMLASFVGKRTIFVVAHRLATVMRADNIIVLDKGIVVEVGKHAELMRREGLYHRMVNLQMFVDDDPTPEVDAVLVGTLMS